MDPRQKSKGAKPEDLRCATEGVGHFLMLERPDEFNKLLEISIKETKKINKI